MRCVLFVTLLALPPSHGGPDFGGEEERTKIMTLVGATP